ncbi:amine sulfotransferase-like [Pecten maximus]|uniref:amine sulfotransferase-like n=1 Tax=Pecten maximus TaxID=6579 RepID=UPI001458449F|nr:amine sulfotransferase-like [Pecten maximus]
MARQGQVKIVHVLRNPKDTFSSLFEFWNNAKGSVYQGDFSGFLDFCLSDEYAIFGGNWFSYVKDWENAKLTNKNLNILSLKYEDVQQNLYGTIVSLVEFLHLDRPEFFLRDVERKVQFENMKKEHETKAGETKFWKDNKRNGRLSIYRKGFVGDWKNYFTVGQNERFDSLYDREIKEYNIDLQFSYE